MPPRTAIYVVLLFLGCACAYLLGNARLPLMDRDEPRYALTARNMLVSGDYVVPRQYDEARAAKPPVIYWVQAASMRILGETAEAVRLPSSLAMLGLMGLLLVFFWRETDGATALLTATIFSSAALTGFVAKLAITDATHTLLTAIVLACTYRLYRGARDWATFLVLGVGMGVALLTKGYISPAIAGMTAAALWGMSVLDRKWPAKASPSTFPYPGGQYSGRMGASPKTGVKVMVAVVLALAIAVPWAVAVESGSPGFFSKLLHKEAIERTSSLKGVDGQARPPGFYLLTVFGTYFPYSLLLPAALYIGWQNRHRPLTRFALAACIGPWLMFETVISKMVHWFLPVFVPLAYLTADAVLRCWRSEYKDLSAKPFRIVAALCSIGMIGAGIAAYPGLHAMQLVPWWVETLFFFWAAYMGIVPFTLLMYKKFPAMIAASAAGMGLLFPLVFGVLGPHLWFLDLPERLASDLRRFGATTKGEVLMVVYKEPSLAFYQGGTIREGLIRDLSNPAINFAVIPKLNWDALGPEMTSQYQILSTQKGIAYASSAKTVDIHVLGRRKAD